MKTPEQKVSDDLTNLMESQWFNPASIARYLTNQPIYTQDKLMELVSYIVEFQNMRHETEWNNGRTSEGLFLATQLNEMLQKTKMKYKFENLRIK